MSDFLLDLGRNPRARKLIRSLGLPIPMPQPLRRSTQPWEERPLHDYDVAVGGDGALARALAQSLCSAGANPFVAGDLSAYREPGEAYGRPAHPLAVDADGQTFHALVFDATGIDAPEGLRALYDFFHPLVRKLGTSSRAVVLGRDPSTAKSAPEAAAQAAVDGFVRSLAKEIGKRGSTANLIRVDKNAESRLDPVLRFVLSPRSAFITGQPIRVTARAKQKAPLDTVHALDGKVALVTGAARGIGEATARLLAAEGAHVVCLDRPADDQLASQVARDIGGSVLLVDVSADDAPARIADHLRQQHGGVDIVVHNAGVTRDKTIANMAPDLWDQAIDINLRAVLRITDALVDDVLRDDGRIVCLSSVAGIAGNVGQTNYAASKAGIIGFVDHQASALAKRGITVNAIAPGFIETRLTRAIPVMIREVGRRLSALGQGGLPQDVGEAITFLALPGAAGITGGVLRVCGGAFIGA
ncbi:MAG: 3-oxoacyl-ACP reductase [Deltaproteobacteria bacterium]|nr:MAG: 3-oxoacyl-ACP reductase [Deltaproteobacteria bacterium]